MISKIGSTQTKSQERGFALLLSIIISSVVLAIGLTLLSLALKQLNLSATSRESEVAFQMANMGMECARYWRDNLATELFNTASPDSAFNSIRCVGLQPAVIDFSALNDLGSSGQQNLLHFELDIPVDGVNRCVQVNTNVITAFEDIDDYLVGRIETDCAEGYTCTVVVSQGYNRSCSEINTSLFSVQRELTAEF